jgi:hypothetical protein
MFYDRIDWNFSRLPDEAEKTPSLFSLPIHQSVKKYQ